VLQNENKPYSNWTKINTFYENGKTLNISNKQTLTIDLLNTKTDNPFSDYMNQHIANKMQINKEQITFSIQELMGQISNDLKQSSLNLDSFLIYSPEKSLLRTFAEEGQIQPLGTKGEGLIKLLRVLSNTPEKINEIKQKLELIDWFDDFKMSTDSELERSIQVKDRYLDKDLPYFNQRSSNEGFLFLMFYFALFVSDDTPKFFAIDNIENGLNPKLCTKLIEELVELAKKYDKQVIFTTHNPAVLDGLDLEDDEQRLFTIYRNIDGHTKAKRVYPRKPVDDDDPVPLSEAFMNGYIGGLPNNF